MEDGGKNIYIIREEEN